MCEGRLGDILYAGQSVDQHGYSKQQHLDLAEAWRGLIPLRRKLGDYEGAGEASREAHWHTKQAKENSFDRER